MREVQREVVLRVATLCERKDAKGQARQGREIPDGEVVLRREDGCPRQLVEPVASDEDEAG